MRHAGAVPELAHVDVHPGPRGHTHLDLRYLLDGGDADPAPPPEESQEVAWFDWPAALAIAEPGMAGILHSLAAAFVVTSADMDIVELHARTVAEFVARAAAVDADQWGAPDAVHRLGRAPARQPRRRRGPLDRPAAGRPDHRRGRRPLRRRPPRRRPRRRRATTRPTRRWPAWPSVRRPAVRSTCRTATRTWRSTSASCRPTT